MPAPVFWVRMFYNTVMKPAPNSAQFTAQIYADLDRKLRNSAWNSGASEAHGLLTALACHGLKLDDLPHKAYLFRLSAADEIALLEGMYGLIIKDLRGEELAFQPLLADDEAGVAPRLEALVDWCGGFAQGIYHHKMGDEMREMGQPNSPNNPNNAAPEWSPQVQEAIHDIMKISALDPSLRGEDATESARRLLEIEEYVRLAVLLIFEEWSADLADSDDSPN